MKKKLTEILDRIWGGFCYTLLVIAILAVCAIATPVGILLFLVLCSANKKSS